MKFIDEYREGGQARRLAEAIARQAHRPLRIMEVCGTHTMAIARYGLRQILPETIELISGPGCPVCVTSQSDMDRGIALAQIPDGLIATFGDMMRVPGSVSTLAQERARGADVRVVYSPLDALRWAEENPHRKVIFLGIGFETTAPAVGVTLGEARKRGLRNFWVFSTHKTIPAALRALLDSGETRVDGFLLPGHVSTIIGSRAYEFLAREYGIACVISGFEPLDLLQSILRLIQQCNEGRPRVEIAYRRGVTPEGNRKAQEVMDSVFEACDAEWRGLGVIPKSGLALRGEWASWDARHSFPIPVPPALEFRGCRCGEVLRGLIRPTECGLFANGCMPENPKGPCMVSSEGSCAAAYKYGR
jgi:hydrogenase expression/formation protein HypD